MLARLKVVSILTYEPKKLIPVRREDNLPLLKQIDGSVDSSKPAHRAFRTAPFASFPAQTEACKETDQIFTQGKEA